MQKLQADSSRQPVIFSRLLKSGALVFLVICTFVLYGPTIDFPFLTLDDPLYVTKHDTIQQGFGKEAIRLAFTEPHAGFWIPLTWLSFMVDYEFSGLLPGGYRLTNILLHCANVLLLFTFIYYLTGYYWRSLLVAGLFAFHPLHVESVVWITERKDVLSLFFLLLACLSYARYAKKPGFLHYLAIVFLYLLGLMAKPMLVTFPFLLLILDYWPLNRFNKNAVTSTVNKPQVSRHSATRLLVEKIPLFIISLFFSIATFMIQNNKGATETFTAHPLLFRIENAIVSYVKYIVLTFWPDRLGLLYPFPEFYSTWQVAFAFVFLFATTFLVVRAGRRLPFLPAGWLWFMVALVPVIGLVQVGYQSHADRFTYIPNIGLYLICAFTAAACVKRWPPVKIPGSPCCHLQPGTQADLVLARQCDPLQPFTGNRQKPDSPPASRCLSSRQGRLLCRRPTVSSRYRHEPGQF
jgi:hypothetical protein